MIYQETTNAVRVMVELIYLPNIVYEDLQQYFWVYNVKLVNNNSFDIQVTGRRFSIIDQKGRTAKIKGSGVVGQSPIIKSNESFSYTSGVHLTDKSGVMFGDYDVSKLPEDSHFKVKIPNISLDIPGYTYIVN